MEELFALLRELETVMLVTRDPEGHLRARAMDVQEFGALDDCDLWFVTKDDGKAHEIDDDEQVCVCGIRQRDKAWVSVTATARCVLDPDQLTKLWKASWRKHFQDGPEDPEIRLLKLTVEHAELWEPAGGKLRTFFEKAKAIAKGGPPQAELPDPVHI